MRLVDFLMLMLEAHAEALKRLAAFFGEEKLLEMLEESESSDHSPAPISIFHSVGSRLPAGARSPYFELEGAVREMGLPAVLEFHLWAYPPYRAFIESDLDLGSRCEDQAGGAALIEQAVSQARQWVHRLPIPPSVAAPAEAAAQVPWIKFRSSAFRRMGLRPMESIG